MSSIRTQQVAIWIEAQNNVASQVMAKLCKLGVFKKVGATRNTCYKLTDHCSNSFEDRIRNIGKNGVSEAASINEAAKYVTNYFINRKTTISETPKVIQTPINRERLITGAKFLKDIIQIAEDSSAENELLKEDNNRLISENKSQKEEIKSLKEEIKSLKERNKHLEKYENFSKLVQTHIPS